MKNNNRLTFCENGRVGIIGMNQSNESKKVIDSVKKLKEYEDTGLSPAEVAALVAKFGGKA